MSSNPLAVIKYGGHAMDDPALNRAFAASLKNLTDAGWRVAVGHGGGPHINAMLEKLNIASHFERGLRVTDEATMAVVEMVLCGKVNPWVVALFCGAGLKAVGLTGRDNTCISARPVPGLGLVGEVTRVDASVPRLLLESGYVPVMAPLGCGPEGQSLNINADTATGALAGALRADVFVLVTDVPGVLDGSKNLLPELSRQRTHELMAEGVISGGMIPKVESCLHALDQGCGRALILDGRAAGNLEACLLQGQVRGTAITH